MPIISRCINVKFKQMNSIKLTYEQDEFDLIWIDGAHGYPFVTFDILNSLRLSNQNVRSFEFIKCIKAVIYCSNT